MMNDYERYVHEFARRRENYLGHVPQEEVVLKHLKIGDHVYIRILPHTEHWTRAGPFRLCAWLLEADRGVLRTSVQALAEQEVRRAKSAGVDFWALPILEDLNLDRSFSLPKHTYDVIADPEFDLSRNWRTAPKVRVLGFEYYTDRVEKPGAFYPPLKMMITDVNLHRLAMGQPKLELPISSHDLIKQWKEIA